MKKKTTLYITIGTLVIAGIGIYSYFFNQKNNQEYPISLVVGNIKNHQKSSKGKQHDWEELARSNTNSYGKHLLNTDISEDLKHGPRSMTGGLLLELSIYGTIEGVQYMKEFLKKCESMLPEPPSSLVEMGDARAIERRMQMETNDTVEGVILVTIHCMVTSGLMEGRIAANEFRENMQRKYANTEYGEIFLKKLDETIAIGERNIEITQKQRENSIKYMGFEG